MDIQVVRDFAPAGAAQQTVPTPLTHPGLPPVPVYTARAPDVTPSPADLAQAVEQINKAIGSMAPGIEFTIDEQLHTTVVKVVDVNTKDVLRQIPSAEMLEIAKSLDKLQGLLISQQA